MENNFIENISMELIANSGDARTLSFQALEASKNKDYALANDLMLQAKSSLNIAHKVQTNLMVNEANGNKNDICVLLIHAQDHLMTSILANELIAEIISLQKTKKDNED